MKKGLGRDALKQLTTTFPPRLLPFHCVAQFRKFSARPRTSRLMSSAVSFRVAGHSMERFLVVKEGTAQWAPPRIHNHGWGGGGGADPRNKCGWFWSCWHFPDTLRHLLAALAGSPGQWMACVHVCYFGYRGLNPTSGLLEIAVLSNGGTVPKLSAAHSLAACLHSTHPRMVG